MKILASDLVSFYADDVYWGKAWIDDTLFKIKGEEHTECNPAEHDPSEVIDVVTGYVYFPDSDKEMTLQNFFKKWKAKQSTKKMVISFDISRTEEITEALKKLGVKIDSK